MLTAERLREVLAYDPKTGVFIWRVCLSNRAKIGAVAGASNPHYRQIRIDGKIYKAHRLAWLHVYGVMPAAQIDHVNGCQSDNRIANLREASSSQNMQNVTHAPASNNSSGLLGVHWHKRYRKWMAQIKLNRANRFLGYFGSKEDAKEFRDLAAAMLHPFSPEARA